MKKIILINFIIFALIAFAVCLFLLIFPQKYHNEIEKYSNQYNLDPVLVASVINAESKYNEQAISKAGAMGLMQLMPSTAFWVAEKEKIELNSKEDLFIPEINIQLGCAYLNMLLNEFKDENTALSAYNAGSSYVKQWLKNEKYSSNGVKLTTTPYKETNAYIQKIAFNKRIYKFCF
ncbi:MAG: lytic transglycosylase domain-containing protein [Clostridia bacterium]|nr:lytic transglycosylase domain-containing protein [Clostridia bacterium]